MYGPKSKKFKATFTVEESLRKGDPSEDSDEEVTETLWW